MILLEKMKAPNLFVFNPEHDLALAADLTNPYTPPASVLKLKKNLSLLPASFADNGDFILIPDNIPSSEFSRLPFLEVCREKNIKIVTPSQSNFAQLHFHRVIPWGWDLALKKLLLDLNIEPDILPSDQNLSDIRDLSHRRLTIPFRKSVCDFLREEIHLPATELFSIDDVTRFLQDYPLCYLKAPWSSSGRGIIVSDHISEKGLFEWAHGTLKRQGSILAEPKWSRILDFATEWFIDKNEVFFIGYSLFETSSRGKYHGNSRAPQEEILKTINSVTNLDPHIIEAQKKALQELVAPRYSGPLGIDMLADNNGRINYCVEINLRLTMGFINLKNGIEKLKE